MPGQQYHDGAVDELDGEVAHNAIAAREYQESVRRFIEGPVENKSAPEEERGRAGAGQAH